MSTPTKRISQVEQWGQERYDLGWADCRKREVEPLREENTRLREALRTIAANTQSAQVKFVAEQALAAGKGEMK